MFASRPCPQHRRFPEAPCEQHRTEVVITKFCQRTRCKRIEVVWDRPGVELVACNLANSERRKHRGWFFAQTSHEFERCARLVARIDCEERAKFAHDATLRVNCRVMEVDPGLRK